MISRKRKLRKTKMVCTIGPATDSDRMIERLITAGMNVARLNFSHGTHSQYKRVIEKIRRISAKLDIPVAILQDLPGPKVRIGALQEPQVQLDDGAEFTLSTRKIVGNEKRVSITLPSFPEDVKKGDTIFLDDGSIMLEVRTKTMTEVCCEVIHGGILAPEKGVNVPGVRLSVNSITEEDYKHLNFGLENGIDYVALSFVRETKDIIGVKDYLRKIDRSIPLIAKIEKHEAIDNLNGIISEADGVMVARGDLGVEMPLKRVPLLQKDIIRRCNRVGKPVIVATQMLESMMRSPRPTRAEVSDVANAILDGTDAVMLSGETAVGHYPIESASMMNQITTEAELSLSYKRLLSARSDTLIPQTDDAIGYAACHIAAQLGAKAIIAYTSSGSTAQRVAKYRPETPILAIAANDEIRRKLALFWGVYSWKSETCSGVEEMFLQGARISIQQGFAREGDLVVVTAGIPLGFPGTTNLVKVQQVYKE